MDLRAFALTVVLLFVIDLPWLFFSSTFVKPMISSIQGEPLQMRLWAAVPVYLALAYLIQFAASAREAFFIGTATYAVYDFTNLSTLQKYSPLFAIADTLWGGILFALVHTALQAMQA